MSRAGGLCALLVVLTGPVVQGQLRDSARLTSEVDEESEAFRELRWVGWVDWDGRDPKQPVFARSRPDLSLATQAPDMGPLRRARRVYLTSVPSGAEVRGLDDAPSSPPRCRTPCRVVTALPVLNVYATFNGVRSTAVEVHTSAFEPETVQLPLPSVAQRTSPSARSSQILVHFGCGLRHDSMLTIDGKALNREETGTSGDLQFIDLPPGEHRLKLAHPDCVTAELVVERGIEGAPNQLGPLEVSEAGRSTQRLASWLLSDRMQLGVASIFSSNAHSTRLGLRVYGVELACGTESPKSIGGEQLVGTSWGIGLSPLSIGESWAASGDARELTWLQPFVLHRRGAIGRQSGLPELAAKDPDLVATSIGLRFLLHLPISRVDLRLGLEPAYVISNYRSVTGIAVGITAAVGWFQWPASSTN